MAENPSLKKVQKIRESGYKERFDKTLKSYTHTLDNSEHPTSITSLKSIEFVDKDNPDLPYMNSDGGNVLYAMGEYDINDYYWLKKVVAIKATWNDGTTEINPPGVVIIGYENETSLFEQTQNIVVKYTDRGITREIVAEASLREYIVNMRATLKRLPTERVLLDETDYEDIVDVRSVLNKYFIIEVQYKTEENPDIWETLDILNCEEDIIIMGWDKDNFDTEQEVTLKVVAGRNEFTQSINMIGRYCDSIKVEIKSGNTFVNLNQLDEIDRVNEREVIAKYLTISTHYNVDPEGVYTPINILTWAEEISIIGWDPENYFTMQDVTLRFTIRGVIFDSEIQMIGSLPPPQNITITAIDYISATVSWDSVPLADEYVVYASLINDSSGVVANNLQFKTSNTSIKVTGLALDTQYYFFVATKTSTGVWGTFSPSVTGKTKENTFSMQQWASYGVYEVSLPPGKYLFECWGAVGSSSGGSGGGSGNVPGKGGYTKGILNLEITKTFYICIDNNSAKGTSMKNGGGAADVRFNLNIGNSNSINKDNLYEITSLRSRIMVAAGGGGSEWSCKGGDGGGLIGGNSNARDYGSNYISYGGTQTSGGNGYWKGGFGCCNNGNIISTSDMGGEGGGGYYTGGSQNTAYGGGGGSSFISGHLGCNAISEDGTHTNQPNHYSGLVFTDTQMIAGNASMPNPAGGTMLGNNGNGYCRITRINN